MVHNVVDVELAGFGEASVHCLDHATRCLVPPFDVAMLPRLSAAVVLREIQ